MESAKRASVVIIVWHLNFSFFLKRGEARGGVKKAQDMQEENAPTTKKTKSAIQKKVKNFSNDFFFHSHRVNALLRFQTHTHTHA